MIEMIENGISNKTLNFTYKIRNHATFSISTSQPFLSDQERGWGFKGSHIKKMYK